VSFTAARKLNKRGKSNGGEIVGEANEKLDTGMEKKTNREISYY